MGKCSVDAIAVSGSLVLERVQMSLHDQTDKIVVKYNELFSVQYSSQSCFRLLREIAQQNEDRPACIERQLPALQPRNRCSGE